MRLLGERFKGTGNSGLLLQSKYWRKFLMLPTMYDLPSEDSEDLGLPDEFHDFQPKLLRETCQPTTYPASEIFVAADLNLYYDGRHPQWYKPSSP
jgi:Uma2 family endonuclease